jgi:hypothetical protein
LKDNIFTRSFDNIIAMPCCAKSKQTQYREYKLKFKNLPEEEKRKRAQELWHVVRLNIIGGLDLRFEVKNSDWQMVDDYMLLNQLEWFQIDPRNSRL